jgi:hypothetical protein
MRVVTLAFVATSAFSFSGFAAALAQPASQVQCNRYAQHAVTQYRRALEGNCDLSRVQMSGNYDLHYRTCLGWDTNRVNSEEYARASENRMACERKVQRPPVAGFQPNVAPPRPAPSRPAPGKVENIAANVPSWRFTSEFESSGYVNCRAITSSGGLEAIAAQRNNGTAYVSIAAMGLRGKFPNSSIVSNGITWRVMAEANGERLWFTGIPANGVDLIMSNGMYEFILSNGQRNTVDLTQRGAAAWAVVRRCVRSALGQ